MDDAAELAILAESDPDARVRRAAICRISDPAVLGRVAAADTDLETRDRASDKLLALATAGPDEATSLGLGFTGAFAALFAYDLSGMRLRADFDHFDYEGLGA